jgi:hypothetical protein
MDIEVLAVQLLLWLDQRASEQLGINTDATAFARERHLAPERLDALVAQLRENQLIRTSRALELCLITDLGRIEANQYRSKERRERIRYTREALFKWLFEQGADTRGTFAYLFRRTPESWFQGGHLRGDEVTAAAHYLADAKLIRDIAPDYGREGPWMLTPKGTDCAMNGVAVSDYLELSDKKSGDTYITNNPRGAVIGGQHQMVVQNNNPGFNLDEVDQLVQVAARARQINPDLGLPEVEQVEVLASAEALERVASTAAPDPSLLRRAADRFMTALGAATQVTGALTALVEQGHRAYSTVFGS